jgi:hypothetical protein
MDNLIISSTPFPAFPQRGRSRNLHHHFPHGGNKKGGMLYLDGKN